MSKPKIYGYRFALLVEKAEVGYIVTCPGIGGVYVEDNSEEAAIDNAIKSAISILVAREKVKSVLTKDNPYLEVINQPITPVIKKITHKQPSTRAKTYDYNYIACYPS